jgi:nicotinamidase-related amidase
MSKELLNVDDSVLCVIDVQPGSLDRIEAGIRGQLRRLAWIAALARALDVPIVVTEEEPDLNGLPSTR